MERLHLRHRVEKSVQGTYYTLAFSVPEGAGSVTVSYRYEKNAAIIDLGLMDADGRFLGWSGSARSTVFTGEFDATPGYLKGAVMPGMWKIIVGAYQVPKDGITVDYEIHFAPRQQEGWLFGDLHMHSDASDGKYSAWELAKMAQKKGLDFIAISNHNNYTDNLQLPDVPGITCIPAVEWTHYKGHMNFFGAQVPFPNSFIANSMQEMHAIIQSAKQAGALISVNHPKCRLCPYLWADEECFDMIEGWNGPMRTDNLRALAWWDAMLRTGRRIPIVGGSDFHRNPGPVRLANPITAVLSPTKSVVDILAAVRQGKSYITNGMTAPRLFLQCGGKTFGDIIDTGEDTQINLGAQNLKAGMKLKICSDGALGETILSKQKDGKIEARFDAAGASFVYLKVIYKLAGKDWVVAVSNPLYFNK